MDAEMETKIDSTIKAVCKYVEGNIEKKTDSEDTSALAQIVSALADLVRARAEIHAENYLPSSKLHTAE